MTAHSMKIIACLVLPGLKALLDSRLSFRYKQIQVVCAQYGVSYVFVLFSCVVRPCNYNHL